MILQSALLLTPVFLFLVCAGFVLPVLLRTFRRCRAAEITPEWLDGFTVSTYYPMERLLSGEDFQFLSRQPGFDLSLYRKLRRDRLRIFRQYLNRLISDFNRLHALARMLIAATPQDRSDLILQLVWLRIRFSVSVLRVEASYVLCRAGVKSLVVRDVIVRLEEMSRQLNALSLSARLELSGF